MSTVSKADLAWGGGIVIIALVATIARQLNFIDSDSAARIVLGTSGLMLAWYGNRMPKAFVPDDCARKVTRVGGWSMAVSGLIYAGSWVLAPFEVALLLGCGAILVGIAVTVAYGRSLRVRAKTA